MKKCTLCGSQLKLTKFKNGHICENCISYLKNATFSDSSSFHLRETTKTNTYNACKATKKDKKK